MSGPSFSWQGSYRKIALFAGVGVALLGSAALAGWLLHNGALKTIIPGSISPIKPNVAAGMLLCGAALALLSRRTLTNPIRVCTAVIAAAVFILSALTVGEYAVGWDLGIEQWLTGEAPAVLAISHSGRMSPITALSFVIVGVALFTASHRLQKRLRLPLVGGLGGALIVGGGVPLAGFFLAMLFGPRWNYMGTNASGIAGALAFFSLGVGLLALLRGNAILTWSLGGWTTAGFASGLALMILATGLTYSFTVKMQQTAMHVGHAQEIRTQLEEIEANLSDLERDQRSYIITANEHLLEGWDVKQSEVRDHFGKLQELQDDNSRRQPLLRQFAALVSKRIDWAKQTTKARRDLGFPTAQAMVATEIGVELLEQSRGLIRAIEDDENARLLESQTQSELASQTVFLMLPLGVFLCFVILSLVLSFLNSGMDQRGQAEKQLRESEEGYRLLVDRSPDAIFVVRDDKVVFVNPATVELLGADRPEQLIGRAPSEIVHPEDRLAVAARLEMVAEGKQAPTAERRMLRLDGSTVEVESRATSFSLDGKPAAQVIVRDITERKRAERQLNIQYVISRILAESDTLKEASAKILQTVCEYLNWEVGEFYTLDRGTGVMQFDELWSAPDAQIDPFIAFSQQTTFVRGIGLPGRAWASGKPVWIPDVAVAENFPRADVAKQVGLHGAFSFPILTGNEVSGVIGFFSREIRQPDEELLRVFAVLGSQLGQFFERKRAEAALQRSEAQTKAIVQASLDCILTIDHEGKILEFNPAAEIIFGYPRAKVLGKELAEVIIPPSLRERHRQGMTRYLTTGEAKVMGKRIEIVAMRSDGSEFPVELAIARLDAEGPPMFTGFIRDITERKRSEEALLRTEEKYRSIVENAVEGVFQTTPDGGFITANRAFARLLGFDSPEELIATRSDIAQENYVDPKSREEFKRLLDENGSVHDFELEAYRKDGTKIWLSENVRIVRDTAGKGSYYEGSAQDITERKRSELVLRESEEYLRLVIAASNDGIWEYDFLSDALTWSDRVYEMFLLDRRSFTPTLDSFTALLHPDDRATFQKTVHEQMASGARYEAHIRILLGDGSYGHFLRRGRAVLDAAGKPTRMVGSFADLTSLLQAEQKLLEQAELLNLSQDAIMVRDMDDRIEFWNHGAEVLYGWTAEEARGRLSGDFLHYDNPVKILAERTLLETGAWSGECRHLTKQGGSVIVRSRWTLVRDEHGQPKSKLVIMTDITEQKKVEEQFLRAQRLESIGTLASGVAHDLNNILVPIMMAAPVLRGNIDSAERERFLDIVEMSAQRGADIIKQVLTFARGADGGDRNLLQPIFLLEEVCKIASQTFPKSIALRTFYKEDIRLLEADSTQLHQILLNLCINARDAMPNGGELCLGAENFDVDERYASITPGATAGPYVMLEVVDTGSGIPSNVIDKIFDPFFTTKSIGLGTGLGLSTVAGIVKSHGGFIDVSSKPGHTRFKIFLPAKAALDTAATLQVDATVPCGNGQTILLVDDEPSIREVAEVILTGHGYKVLVAEDSPSALAIFAQQMGHIAVVVTDLAMPGMDGLMLVSTLRRIEPGLKVIVSTGRTDDSHAAEITALRVDGCLTKPYTTRNLLLKLSHVLYSGMQHAA